MIRRKLNSDERIDNPGSYRELFLGACFGVGLRPRGWDDNHVCFDILTEDDEYWFVNRSGGSSHWMPELLEAMQAAIDWCKANALADIDNDIQYGYIFSSK